MPRFKSPLASTRGQKHAGECALHWLEFLAAELIGKQVSVHTSSCKDLRKVQGKIIDETVNTFVIETLDKKIKVVPKATCVFQFKSFQIDGKLLVGKPEDRTKKFLS